LLPRKNSFSLVLGALIWRKAYDKKNTDLVESVVCISQMSNNCRTFTIERVDGSFGFVLRGHSPVCIESVLTGGPADRAGLRPGDGIVKLNGIDVR